MRVLFIGNHLHEAGYNIGVSFGIADHLRRKGFDVLFTSCEVNKIRRLVDMLMTIMQRRKEYNVAQVDVFSGSAFLWAFLSTMLLKILGKPIILTLHGGNLPAFAKKYPPLIRWTLNMAYTVTVPSKYLFNTMQCYRGDLKLNPNPLDIQSYKFGHRTRSLPVLIW